MLMDLAYILILVNQSKVFNEAITGYEDGGPDQVKLNC